MSAVSAIGPVMGVANPGTDIGGRPGRCGCGPYGGWPAGSPTISRRPALDVHVNSSRAVENVNPPVSISPSTFPSPPWIASRSPP